MLEVLLSCNTSLLQQFWSKVVHMESVATSDAQAGEAQKINQAEFVPSNLLFHSISFRYS